MPASRRGCHSVYWPQHSAPNRRPPLADVPLPDVPLLESPAELASFMSPSLPDTGTARRDERPAGRRIAVAIFLFGAFGQPRVVWLPLAQSRQRHAPAAMGRLPVRTDEGPMETKLLGLAKVPLVALARQKLHLYEHL